MSVRVAFVIVSHSSSLASGVAELAAQMAPDVHFEAAGGTEDGRIGTSYDRVPLRPRRRGRGPSPAGRAGDGAGRLLRGHLDPGAVSTSLILRAAVRAAGEAGTA